MITLTKNYTKKKEKDRPYPYPRKDGKKQSYSDKITQRSIHINTQKKRKRKKK